MSKGTFLCHITPLVTSSRERFLVPKKQVNHQNPKIEFLGTKDHQNTEIELFGTKDLSSEPEFMVCVTLQHMTSLHSTANIMSKKFHLLNMNYVARFSIQLPFQRYIITPISDKNQTSKPKFRIFEKKD